MMEWSEAATRLTAFAAIFLTLAVGELWAPRRVLVTGRGRRWLTNFALLALDVLCLRLVFPLAAVGIALWAQHHGFGLFPWLGIPTWLAGLLAFLLLDLSIWVAHLAAHKVPFLWRFHKVHHADRDVDVTTALRFHPGEILLSMLWKGGVIVVLGAPPVAVLVFEIVLNGAAMFTHANWRLPRAIDRALRLVIVTPDMHRVHHSAVPCETDSNYGFNFAFWDRLFRTYEAAPRDGHEEMRLGLTEHQTAEPTHFLWSLTLPFRCVTLRATLESETYTRSSGGR